jgi:hypothetical protein
LQTTNGERFCDDSFGSAVTELQEAVRAVGKQIKPWKFHEDPDWHAFTNQKCLGAPFSPKTCEEDVRERFEKEPLTPEFFERMGNMVFSLDNKNARFLKNVTDALHPPPCFAGKCSRIQLPFDEKVFHNLTLKFLNGLHENCEHCWVQVCHGSVFRRVSR